MVAAYSTGKYIDGTALTRVGRYYDISSKSCQYPLAIQLLHVINLMDTIV